jgi:hypothetical protein
LKRHETTNEWPIPLLRTYRRGRRLSCEKIK